jgi:hypothetical protein
MRGRLSYSSPGTLLALFLVIVSVPLIALAWIGSRFLEQERALDLERGRERQENAANQVINELDRGLGAWETLLPVAEEVGRFQSRAAPRSWSSAATVWSVARVSACPTYPAIPTQEETPATVFAAAEALEFSRSDLDKATAMYVQELENINAPA